MSPEPLRAKFSLPWVILWGVCIAVLTGLLVAGVGPLTWGTAFLILFMLPEMVGLARRGDKLPPLTYVVRRYAPRWLPDAVTWAVAGWMFTAWVVAGAAVHPILASILIFGTAGWLTNHWDVTYDGPGE